MTSTKVSAANSFSKLEEAAAPKAAGGSHPTRSAAARWGKARDLFNEGFVVVPNRFLRQYASLRPALSAGEALFVLQLMTFKWDEKLPYPTYKTIAERMDITDKMARRYAQSLDRKGYLHRQYQKRAANRFDLSGLFEALSKAPFGNDLRLQNRDVKELDSALVDPVPADGQLISDIP